MYETIGINYLNLNNNLFMQIYQFTLQIIHHPLKLSGLGLFDFGNDFLRKVCFYIYTFIFYYYYLYIFIFILC